MTTAFALMAIGLLVFLLTIPLYAGFGIDADIIGLVIFTVGLAICVIGTIRRRSLHGWKLVAMAVLAAALFLPVVSLMVSLIYYAIAGKGLGN